MDRIRNDMKFADIHIHALYGSDDGPKTEQQMQELVDAAYADGTRVLCLTPHYHPGYFGENRDASQQAFEALTAYAREKYPDLELYLGNELRYSRGCGEWLETGACRTLNRTDHVLVDFYHDEPQKNIVRALERLMNAGYTPVLAHVERYREISTATARELARKGIWLQIDVQSLFGGYGLGAQLRAKALLKAGLVDIVSSDAHDLSRRRPELSKGYQYVTRKYGEEYANAVFYENAVGLLEGGNQ